MALVLKSESQILSDMISTFLAQSGVNDIRKVAVIRALFEAAAQEDFSQYYALLQVIKNYTLDSTTGEDLENRAFEYGLTRFEAAKATGLIDILRPSGFTKVSTSFYAGNPLPLIGDTTIYVNDASDALYGASGTLILGRGTSNEEEVTYAIAPTDFTNYWEFTVSALTKDHDLSETVILKQGSDETIPKGTIVQAGQAAEALQFIVDNDTTLLAGEDKVEDVEITAESAGSEYNIAIGDITGTSAFPTAPFTGAQAENTSRFTTGRDLETDDSLRDRIKEVIPSNSKGITSAILNGIVGLIDPDTAKRVVSANVVLPSESTDVVKVIIDDGIGFEPSFSAQGFETVVEEATGGESRLQLEQFPLVKAQVESNNAEPFDMSSGALTLTVETNLQTETITFNPSDFDFPEIVTAEEIVTVINNKAVLFESFTSQTQTKMLITAKSETNEDIRVTGGTANDILGFPTDLKSTLFLYKNDALLSKDGATAFVDSQNSANYDLAAIGAFPQDLTLIIDGKTANPQTITFQAVDFGDTGAATVAEIVAVINAQLAGGTAISIESDSKVRIISNLELSADSKVEITGGTINNAVNGLNFDTTEVVGKDKDYTLNRELGTIQLEDLLTADDQITSGTIFSRAYLRAASAETYGVGGGNTLVISIDGAANQTITFAAPGIYTAQEVADLINAQLDGGTAISRTIGNDNYLEIRTNTLTEASGSIRIDSTSTAVVFGFTLDTTIENLRPHASFQANSNAAPYPFVEGDNLIAVIDNNPAVKTYNIVMDYDDEVTSGDLVTRFISTVLKNIFTANTDLVDFYCVMKTGNNTYTDAGVVTTVSRPGGNTSRYALSGVLANYGDFAIGDMVTFSGMDELDNNGTFLITGKNSGPDWIEVTNADGLAEAGATGDVFIGQRRQISTYNSATGQIVVSAGYTTTPVSTEEFIILPSTIDNMILFLNKTKITALSNSAEILGVLNNTRIQIASNSEGSDGYVQITGGSANDILGFSTALYRGLYGYNNYTGLLKVVHRTIYGDDQDFVSYPGIGAAGIQFRILPPTIQAVPISLTLTLASGINISQLEDQIKSAITSYINNLDIGDDVILEEIRSRVIQLNNVLDVVAVSPTSNVAISDSEKAKTRNSLITLG